MKIMRWLLPLIGVVLLFYILSRIGISKMLNAFNSANYYYLLFMLLLFIPSIIVQTAKWQYLLIQQKLKFNFGYLIKLQLISLFYEAVTPGRVGSFIKIAYINKNIRNLGKSCSSVVIDRALDFLFVAALAFLGSLLIMKSVLNIFYISVILFALFLVGFVILINKNATRTVLYIFYKMLIPERLKERTKNSFGEFYKNIPSLKSIFITFLLTAALWIIIYTQAYLTAMAFNVNVPYLKFMVLFPISVLISLVPITVSGFGTREAVLIKLFEGFGTAEGIVASSLVWACAALVIYAIFGLYLIFKLNIKNEE